MGEQIQQDDDVDGTAPGPDERDLDLLDGSWEQQYYSGEIRTRDWNAVGVGVALLVIASLVIPMFLVLTR